jgi:hypothetical protein
MKLFYLFLSINVTDSMFCTEQNYFMQSDIQERHKVYFAVYSMHVSLIAGFRREVAENCAVLGYYAASSG